MLPASVAMACPSHVAGAQWEFQGKPSATEMRSGCQGELQHRSPARSMRAAAGAPRPFRLNLGGRKVHPRLGAPAIKPLRIEGNDG